MILTTSHLWCFIKLEQLLIEAHIGGKIIEIMMYNDYNRFYKYYRFKNNSIINVSQTAVLPGMEFIFRILLYLLYLPLHEFPIDFV